MPHLVTWARAWQDIEVAPDFFSYFTHTAPLLEADPTLLAVSAFNDNGQAAYRGAATALHRSDFFPGLGWLLTRELWGELGSKWPNERGFWDDWLREPAQRKGRATIRPEVSRSYTFGSKGTSVGQFYKKYLEGMGAKIPDPPKKKEPEPEKPKPKPAPAPPPEEEEEDEDEFVEAEQPEPADPDLMAPDDDAPAEMGGGGGELSEAELEKLSEHKMAASEALSNGELAKARADEHCACR